MKETWGHAHRRLTYHIKLDDAEPVLAYGKRYRPVFIEVWFEWTDEDPDGIKPYWVMRAYRINRDGEEVPGTTMLLLAQHVNPVGTSWLDDIVARATPVLQ